MLNHQSSFIGYKYNAIKMLLDSNKELVIKKTQTVFKNKLEERINEEPIVIKHTEEDNKIVLTLSYFK